MPAASAVVVGDLSSLAGMRQVAEQADAVFGSGPFDAIIHNAGVGHRDQHRRVLAGQASSPIMGRNKRRSSSKPIVWTLNPSSCGARVRGRELVVGRAVCAHPDKCTSRYRMCLSFSAATMAFFG